jgi:hypothetical protein
MGVRPNGWALGEIQRNVSKERRVSCLNPTYALAFFGLAAWRLRIE